MACPWALEMIQNNVVVGRLSHQPLLCSDRLRLTRPNLGRAQRHAEQSFRHFQDQSWQRKRLDESIILRDANSQTQHPNSTDPL